MKLAIESAGQDGEIEFTQTNGAAQLKRGAQTELAQISQPEPGLFTVLLNQRVYRCWLSAQTDGAHEVIVNGRRFAFTVRDKKHLRGSTGGGVTDGKAVLAAPMPGKVVRLLCAVGAEVTAQQGLLVVEAMKMQNEVQAPKAGKIVELRVTEGQTVNAGETLVVVE